MTTVINPFTEKKVKLASFNRYIKNYAVPFEILTEVKIKNHILNFNNQYVKQRKLSKNEAKKGLSLVDGMIVDLKKTVSLINLSNHIKKGYTINIDENEKTLRYILDNININKRNVITINNDKIYTLSEKTRDLFYSLLEGKVIEFQEEHGWDREIDSYYREGIKSIEIISFIKGKGRSGAAFLDFFHNIEGFDFSRYGIFDKFDKENYVNNCLHECFRLEGFEDQYLYKLKDMTKDRTIPKLRLKIIAEKLNCVIELTEPKHNWKRTIYGEKNKGLKTIKIFIMYDHYFLNEKTNITTYALEHYEEIKHMKDFNRIIWQKKTGYYERTKDDKLFCSSAKLIELLKKNDLITKMTIDELWMTQYSDKINMDEVKELSYLHTCVAPIVFEKKEKKPLPRIWFDCETTTNIKSHEVYQICYYNEKGEPFKTTGSDWTQVLKTFLNSIKEDWLLIAHNLGYDFRFVLPLLCNIRTIEKEKQIMWASASYYNYGNRINLTFKDSCALISMPLNKFSKTFMITNADVEGTEKPKDYNPCKDLLEKEVMPYGLYDDKTIKEEFVTLKQAMKHLKKNEHKQFLDNIEKWKLYENKNEFMSYRKGEKKRNGIKFNHLKYSEKYCLIDCQLLRLGYLKFQEWMMEITGEDIDCYISLPSNAHSFLKKEGCFDGCFSFSGVVREFISLCVVGGRTMTNMNKKYYIEEDLNDFDAVSLYPSAMQRMQGFLKGCPKVLTEFDYNKIKHYDGLFVKIKILKVNKRRQFPLQSIKDDKGVRVFTNELENTIAYVCKTALEDLIKFQGVEFEILQGYYFDEGFNTKINETITKLFNERKKMKAKGNPIEQVYKLLMNWAYGKTIMKPIEYENKFVFDEKLEKFIDYNYNQIKYLTQIPNSRIYMAKRFKPINEHFSQPHIGAEILAWSKRIMNEVMTTAEDIGAMIYYQDTDSMHIQNNKIDLLSKEYKKRYGKDLIGSDMGQFHCDFDDFAEKKEGVKLDKPISKKSIFLAKKCYIDELEQNKEKGYHIRMRGIPGDVIKNYAKHHDKNPFDLYEQLYKGETIKFDLVKFSSKPRFEFKRNYTIANKKKFIREAKF